MLQSLPAEQSIFTWPKALTLEPYQSLETYQIQKVAAVALACLALFGIQLGCSWGLAIGIALIGSTITLLSETFLRTDHSQNINWTNTDVDTRFLMIQVAFRIVVLPIIIGLMMAFATMPLIQAVALEILAGNMKMILLATLIAPIAEEILFRGFIQERLEDMATLFDHYIYPLPESAKEWFSISVQSLLFGAVHITGAQVLKSSMKAVVFGMTSLLGFLLAILKNMDKSLLPPIAIHWAQNTGFVLGLLAARR